MKSIILKLKKFIQEDFHLKTYLNTIVFTAILFTLNYITDFEDGILDVFNASKPIFVRFLTFFFFQSFIYYGTVGVMKLANKKLYFSSTFFLMSALGLVIWSFNRAANILPLTKIIVEEAYLRYYFYCFRDAVELFTVILPLIMLWWLKFRKQPFGFGLSIGKDSLKPYFSMLLIMVPLIAIAATQPSFLKVYPKCPNTSFFPSYLNSATSILFFEGSYGIGFISVEMFFRGFLVIGLAKYAGTKVILPMVVLYAAIHFGKPLGEAIGSIFGGFILGIIAYYSRSIWGGIIVHLGVAWLMELFAFIIK